MSKLTGRKDQRGLWLAVLGPDGAGKSAVIRRLARDSSLPFQAMEQFHFRPGFGRRKTDAVAVTDPHGSPPRSLVISILKLLYWLMDCWLGYMLTVRRVQSNSGLVLFDRYLDDIQVDPRRYRLPLSSLWFAKVIVHLAPRPDVYVLLDVPADIVQRRKAEVLPAESHRQRLSYLELFRWLPNACVVDATAPVDQVAAEVKIVVLKSLAASPGTPAEVSGLPAADPAERAVSPLPENPAAATVVQEFLSVPGEGTPRWLLPAWHHNVDPALACWSPYLWKSRAKWLAIRAAHRAGFLEALPNVTRVRLPGIESIDWRFLGWSGDSSPVPLVYVGTPGMSRKAVIHLVNPESGTCGAVVKAPLTQAAHSAILREADVLATLAEENYGCAPRLLYADDERGLATQTALNGRPGSRKLTAEHWALLRSLMLDGERTTIAGHTAEWQAQQSQVAECEADVMTAAWREVCDLDPLPACWVHGDFAPWNIRHLPDGRVVLLDWEAAQRSGLPLQDAFHFLHIQDYLFGARPAVHSAEVEPFARSIGLSREQVGKLEIAYLAHSYLQRQAAGEVEHAEYLLNTLRIALQERGRVRQPVIDFANRRPAHSAQIVAFPPPSRARSDLFAAVIAQLNAAEVPYCVLSGHEKHTENCSSDVDFMFHPRDMHRIAPLLAQATREAGGRLIQVMPHETSACHFVIAKDDGSQIGYFDPDCTADYRKHGRLWLAAEKVLARRRRCRNLYVPAVPDEFTYYLIKKVLKQAVADFQLRRLRHLYQRDPANCRTEIEKFWSVSTVRAVERALMASDLGWLQSHLPALLTELQSSAPVEGLGRRVEQKFQDGIRILRRALHPTGMSVLVCDGDQEQRSAIADALAMQLSPAFRRTARVQLDPEFSGAPTSSFYFVIQIFAARIRSTLVVNSADGGKLLARSLCPGPNWLATLFARLLFRPDLVFVLTAGDGQALARVAHDLNFISAARKGRVIYLNSCLSVEQNSQQAVGAVLLCLATRQAKSRSFERKHEADSRKDPLTKIMSDPAGLRLVVK